LDLHHRHVHDGGILVREADEVLDTFLPRIGLRFLDTVGVDVKPEPARSVALRRHDGHAPISAAQIIHDVRRPHLGHFEHALDHFGGREPEGSEDPWLEEPESVAGDVANGPKEIVETASDAGSFTALQSVSVGVSRRWKA
jgi:hypothetical protein